MKKNQIVLSIVTLLSFCITACSKPASSKEESSSKKEESSAVVSSSQNPSSTVESSEPVSTSSEESTSLEESSVVIPEKNFDVTIPEDLSMMSANCKQYVDDMREQQEKLLEERGEDADYYLNDLFGLDGVDLTKGVTASSGNYQDNTGGYRDGTVENDYLDPIGADWEKGEKSDENKGVKISFAPKDALKDKEYTFTYSVNADLSDGKSIVTSNTSVTLKNLLVNQKYYFKVEAEGEESELLDFTTGDYPRWIDARPMFNVRDMGGYMTSSGQRIKQGMVYRGGEINNKTGWYGTQRYTDDTGNTSARDGHIVTESADSKEAFREDMGMINGLEIDLRSSTETNGYPATSNVCNFAEDGDISYKMLSISSYANGMKNNTSQIKQVFEAFAEADEHPVYYHCYGGADRTGVVGFMLGALLGMSYTDLVIDFELTSYSSNPSRNYRSHLRNGPWNEWPGMVDYLKNTGSGNLGWGDSTTIKDGMEAYLKEKCNVSQDTIDTIRDIMLEPEE